MSQWARENPELCAEGVTAYDYYADRADHARQERKDNLFYLDEDGNRVDPKTGLPFTERDELRQLEQEKKDMPCLECEGKGYVDSPTFPKYPEVAFQVTRCPVCDGRGK